MNKKRFVSVSMLFLSLFSARIYAQGGGTEYGTRINLPPDAVVTADFVDKDGDGIDDRYQMGPGIPPEKKKEITLPKIEYIKGYPSHGMSDVRLGVKLFAEYSNLKEGKASKLKPDMIGVPKVLLESIINQESPSISFSFRNGTKILFCASPQVILVGSSINPTTGWMNYLYMGRL